MESNYNVCKLNSEVFTSKVFKLYDWRLPTSKRSRILF